MAKCKHSEFITLMIDGNKVWLECKSCKYRGTTDISEIIPSKIEWKKIRKLKICECEEEDINE